MIDIIVIVSVLILAAVIWCWIDYGYKKHGLTFADTPSIPITPTPKPTDEIIIEFEGEAYKVDIEWLKQNKDIAPKLYEIVSNHLDTGKVNTWA